MPIQARRLDQTHDRRRPLAGAQRAGEEPILAANGNWPDLVLDPVVIDGNVSIGQVTWPPLSRCAPSMGALLRVQVPP